MLGDTPRIPNASRCYALLLPPCWSCLEFCLALQLHPSPASGFADQPRSLNQPREHLPGHTKICTSLVLARDPLTSCPRGVSAAGSVSPPSLPPLPTYEWAFGYWAPEPVRGRECGLEPELLLACVTLSCLLPLCYCLVRCQAVVLSLPPTWETASPYTTGEKRRQGIISQEQLSVMPHVNQAPSI